MNRYNVYVEKCVDYNKAESAFLRLIGNADMEKFQKQVKGKTVLIKPNIIGAFDKEKAATTHPSIIKIVTNWMRTSGADVIVGDNCGVGDYGNNKKAAKKSGILDASDGAFKNIANSGVNVQLNSTIVKNVVVSGVFFDVDYVINVPKIKTHVYTTVSFGVKNMFGMLVGNSKGKMHSAVQNIREFNELLTAIYEIRPPDLTIVDGVIAMDKHGPTHGRPRSIGYLVAGLNTPSVDFFLSELLSVDRKKMLYLNILAKKEMGPKKLEEINIVGKYQKIKNFKLPNIFNKESWFSEFFNNRAFDIINKSRLRLLNKKCNKCKDCFKTCPQNAIKWTAEGPIINKQLCILCLCCYELCNKGAWQIKGALWGLRGFRDRA